MHVSNGQKPVAVLLTLQQGSRRTGVARWYHFGRLVLHSRDGATDSRSNFGNRFP